MGQTCTSHPGFSGSLAPLDRPISRPYQVGGVSGAATEGRAAATGPSTARNSHVFLPGPRHPHHRQLDGQLGKQQWSRTQWQERGSCHHDHHIQHYKPQPRPVEFSYYTLVRSGVSNSQLFSPSVCSSLKLFKNVKIIYIYIYIYLCFDQWTIV